MTICSICTKCSYTLSKRKWISLKSINESFCDALTHSQLLAGLKCESQIENNGRVRKSRHAP